MVYVHQFKTEAKRCSFTYDAATIRIFIKSLKNAHSLATCIYEKGPQMLSNAISEVKKLNAVQQLTATITPPSMVNKMSNDKDWCFQYQECSHIARNCPSIRCFECDEFDHIIMDCLHRIPPSGTPTKHTNLNHIKATTPDLAPDTAMRTGPGDIVPGHSHISTDTAVPVVMICIKAITDYDIGIIATTTGIAHDAQIPHRGVTAIDPTVTHHIDHTAGHVHT